MRLHMPGMTGYHFSFLAIARGLPPAAISTR
jgi:hypothetical protein